jgi:predicted PurR-regulated permease PerM
VEVGVGSYLRSQFLLNVLAAFLLGVGYSTMGLSYPAPLVLAALVIRHIPWFGPLIIVLLPLLVGMAVSPGLGLLAATYAAGVLLLLKLVEPRLIKTQGYNTLLVLLWSDPGTFAWSGCPTSLSTSLSCHSTGTGDFK